MSAVCTKWSAGLFEFRLDAHTCTWPVDSPPVTFRFSVWAEVASIVSMIVL